MNTLAPIPTPMDIDSLQLLLEAMVCLGNQYFTIVTVYRFFPPKDRVELLKNLVGNVIDAESDVFCYWVQSVTNKELAEALKILIARNKLKKCRIVTAEIDRRLSIRMRGNTDTAANVVIDPPVQELPSEVVIKNFCNLVAGGHCLILLANTAARQILGIRQ